MTRWIIVAVLVVLTGAGTARADAPMTLRDAVMYALEHSPDLKSADAEIRRREGLVNSAHSLLLPQLSVSGDAALSRFERSYPAGAPPSQLRFDTTLYTGGADLKWLIWDFGRTQLELAATRERVGTARAAADRRRQEIIFETARLFLQTLAYADLIDAAEARTDSLRSLVTRSNRLVSAGRAVPIDVLKVRTRLAQVESDLAMLQSGRRSSLSALAAVMGLEGELPSLAATFSASGSAVLEESEGALLREAMANRPEIVAQTHEIRGTERAEHAARTSAWPRIDLRASVIPYYSSNPLGFAQLVRDVLPAVPATASTPAGATTDWLVGVRVSWLLFDGGRRRGEIAAAHAQFEEARLARTQAELRITREVRAALADLESAQARVTALRDAVAESDRVLHDERLKYEAGRSAIDFVLDAESALLTSESLLSQAQRSVSIAALALDLAVGCIDGSRLPGQ